MKIPYFVKEWIKMWVVVGLMFVFAVGMTLYTMPAEAEGVVDYWAAQEERDRTADARAKKEAYYEDLRYEAEQDHERGHENSDSYHDLKDHTDDNRHDY